MFIKNADFGGVVLPEGTDKRATFHVASLSLDTSGYKNILIHLAFSCNIIAEKLKLRLRFQILRQESGQGVTVPVSAGILYDRDKVCSVIKADNFASIKVAESIGMSKEDEFITQYYNGDMLHFLYSAHK